MPTAKNLESGPESFLSAGSAGEFSGPCCTQHGCWLPQGMVIGGRAARTNCAHREWLRGQQECWCAAEDVAVAALANQDRIAKGEATSDAMLQQSIDARTAEAKILLLILQPRSSLSGRSSRVSDGNHIRRCAKQSALQKVVERRA
jgi:hypothetical protein